MIDYKVVDELVSKLVTQPTGGEKSEAVDVPNENVGYLLTKCNGGYSKDGYFHFFGNSGDDAHSIERWNSPDLWRKCYGDLVEDYYFFAEDIFGNQFGHKLSDPSDEVFLFWVDDGRVESFEADFVDFLVSTVYGTIAFDEMRSISSEFQARRASKVPMLHHLTYRIPLLLGGRSDDLENLEISPAVDHLRFSGQVVVQCRALPVGTRITDVLVDEASQTITLVAS
jgi:hypothetical protein